MPPRKPGRLAARVASLSDAELGFVMSFDPNWSQSASNKADEAEADEADEADVDQTTRRVVYINHIVNLVSENKSASMFVDKLLANKLVHPTPFNENEDLLLHLYTFASLESNLFLVSAFWYACWRTRTQLYHDAFTVQASYKFDKKVMPSIPSNLAAFPDGGVAVTFLRNSFRLGPAPCQQLVPIETACWKHAGFKKIAMFKSCNNMAWYLDHDDVIKLMRVVQRPSCLQLQHVNASTGQPFSLWFEPHHSAFIKDMTCCENDSLIVLTNFSRYCLHVIDAKNSDVQYSFAEAHYYDDGEGCLQYPSSLEAKGNHVFVVETLKHSIYMFDYLTTQWLKTFGVHMPTELSFFETKMFVLNNDGLLTIFDTFDNDYEIVHRTRFDEHAFRAAHICVAHHYLWILSSKQLSMINFKKA